MVIDLSEVDAKSYKSRGFNRSPVSSVEKFNNKSLINHKEIELSRLNNENSR